ncbi:winged helix-turn-helix domain-containing protein [Rubellimicrobium rubrum]|uniref:Winged helix-turn-helix domain-containing protein n=1 Tax=Rubellimicrobium rubrum TaxID=2585369 RepID=A0A5C4MXN7_9RHOB|nr:crosslink repair DNA glycosylase YcaQ family protein [Rubellimicrobium rubrum]TNC49833.1 winged helix-turn-helix domain-containing protein [Rubellimicrobium rubrum]
MVVPILSNDAARKLFLARHGLLDRPRAQDLTRLLDGLGFVQVDSVLTLARAHDMILWSRHPGYRPPDLQALVQERRAFEHWTHDAAVIPVEFWPHWRHRFDRDRQRLDRRWEAWHGPDFRAQLDRTLRHITDNGPVRSGDLADGPRREPGWWNWHPSKVALEYLWRVGELSVARRDAFQKVYDLTERVIPEAARAHRPDLAATIDWAACAALDRLGFATPGEIAAFWDLLTPAEAQAWAKGALERREVEEIRVEGADGSLRRVLARPRALEQAAALTNPGDRLRILSPFDPALRDRARAERLFGFRYRIEIFVPAAKRTYGYYVFPLLEGTRLVGRADLDSRGGALTLRALWPEAGVRWGKERTRRLMAELERVARFSDVARIDLRDGWLRQAP